MVEPGLLECGPGEFLSYKDGDGCNSMLDPEVIKRFTFEHFPVIQYVADWQSGAFLMSEKEYMAKAAIVFDIRAILHKVIREAKHGS